MTGESGNPLPETAENRSSRSASFRRLEPVWKAVLLLGLTGAVLMVVSEFLTLRSVSCDGLTLQGSGTVEVSVPRSCHTGVNGSSTFKVDLGPPQATDEPLGLGATPIYGKTVTVALTRLHGS